LGFSSVCTHPPSIPAPVWGWRFASGSWNEMAAASGWNLNSGGEPPSSSPFPLTARDLSAAETAQRTILLVEDNPADITLVRELIADYGLDCSLTVISDGAKAMAYVTEVADGASPRPDLVILDIHLPKRSGLEVLAQMKGSMHWNSIPIVVLSSSGADTDKSAAMSLGATRYLQKPHTLDGYSRIVTILRDLLSREEAQG
jgi:two-component system, chemotaxis family, response regulator Rcp1